jgi:hypothetical protein
MHMCNLNDEDTGKQWQIVEIYIKFYAKKKKKKKWNKDNSFCGNVLFITGSPQYVNKYHYTLDKCIWCTPLLALNSCL